MKTIRAQIPHRHPFLLVDRIVECNDKDWIVGIKNVAANEPCFQGHFPGMPIFPGVLQLEAMAQTAGILLNKVLGSEGKVAFYLGVDKAKFRQPVYPGSQLEYVCEIRQMNEFGGKVAAVASVGGTVCAECGLLFSFHEFGNPTQNAVRERILDTWLTNAKRLP